MQNRTIMRPKRGRPREDVKQIKIPETAYKMLYAFAEAHNMTFGDAAAKLIRDSILDFVGEGPTPGITGLHFDRVRKQVKVPIGTHAALFLFASYHSMTIGDAAALLIGVSLTEYYGLDEDTETGQGRGKRGKKSRKTDAAVERAKRRERQDRLHALREAVRQQLGLSDSGPATT
jgi:hypothetical protein